MRQTTFVIKACTLFEQEIRIVGNNAQLGTWKPQNALKCVKIDQQQWESSSPIQLSQNEQFQFKIIKVRRQTDGHPLSVKWQELPNNSNRKFISQQHSRLVLKWSQPKGNVYLQKLQTNCQENKPHQIISSELKMNKPKFQKATHRNQKSFNPDQIAKNDSDNDSDNQKKENQSFGSFVGRKKSKDIRISLTKEELQVIYYSWIFMDKNKEKQNKAEQKITEGKNKQHETDFVITNKQKLSEAGSNNNYINKDKVRELIDVAYSIVVINSKFKEIDRDFFNALLPQKNNQPGRMAIIIDQEGQSEEISRIFRDREDICIVDHMFQKLYIFGALYQPSKRHQQLIDFLKKKIILSQKIYGGQLRCSENSLTYLINENNREEQLILKLSKEIKHFLKNEKIQKNYFEISAFRSELIVRWNLRSDIRLIKTLFRLKEIEDGHKNCQIFFISLNDDKKQFFQKRLINSLQEQQISRNICCIQYND